MIALLVDDGVSKRSNRNSLMSKDHKFCGISAGEHKEAERCVIIKYAG